MRHILALDQGTSSSRAIVFDESGRIAALAQREFTQHFPRPGWVEHDAMEIWQTQLAVARDAVETVKKSVGAGAQGTSGEPLIVAIGIANQRETTVLWDRSSGEPVAPAIVWQDRRTADACERLRRDGHAVRIRRRTGLELDAYFSATKLAWLLDHVPGARARAARGELAFGTIDSWLVWRLTGGRVHATDAGNAARTMLMNLHTLDWDDVLLELLRIPRTVLPRIVPSCGVLGECDPALLGVRLPIAGLAGDQQAATFGQCCFAPGTAKNTYGTGCFMLMNTGDRPVASRHRLLSTVGWRGPATGGGPDPSRGRGQTAYCLEGSVFIGGAVVQWLRDGLGLIERSADVQALAAQAGPVDDDLFLVPAFAGLGAPHWDPWARGLLIGITRGTTAAQVARAALESIALQTADVFDAMAADSRIALTELRVDGGAARDDLLMQLQADVLGVPVVRPALTETTAFGAAALAGLAVGLWRDARDIEALWRVDRRFQPQMAPDARAARRARWREAVARARGWARRQAAP